MEREGAAQSASLCAVEFSERIQSSEFTMKKGYLHFITIKLLNIKNTYVVNLIFAKNSSGEHADDNGFGKLYKWQTVTNGFVEAKKSRKPIMIIIHKSGCQACINLHKKFANSPKLLDLSQHFVMINVDSSRGDELPDNFFPDGSYVPRILFMRPDGELLREIVNTDPNREPNYKYSYWSIRQIADSMQTVLKMFPYSPTA
ncbi:thioredoxin domain-containing protein 12-like [Athalia rosae]|uniref:thioredoxin domain-containing protein 12-like n=1 Tax=Athalia rosae TaxID=37344 RepID=UPI000625F267|nr:thioredoxin domain-containing protein 12-like [Athalia rosae]